MAVGWALRLLVYLFEAVDDELLLPAGEVKGFVGGIGEVCVVLHVPAEGCAAQ